jgi:TolB-like protein/cytochrome c-type biogenesis protein CcmH/NrfG
MRIPAPAMTRSAQWCNWRESLFPRTLLAAGVTGNAVSFIKELKRRNVFRVAIAYVITCWLLLQVADVVLGNIEAPGWVFKAIMLLLGLGFPVVLLFAWAFELTPEGIKREKEVDRTRSITHATGRKLDFAIIALLAIGLAYFIWEARFSTGAKGPGSPVAVAQGTGPENALPAESASVTPTEPAPAEKSVAVLPFTTRSTIEDDRFFSDGMHDDLLTQLAKIGDLNVISRTSVMEYRDSTKNLRQIGAELGVAAILEGAVQRAGQQVRINVQLIDAQTDKHLWAETYDRELTTDNLFAIQSDIAHSIATAMKATLSPDEEQRIGQRNLTDNLEALRAYQRSRLLGANFEQAMLERAAQEARNALALDPGFAAAWAQLARSEMALYWHHAIKPEYLQAAREAIDKGRAIEPQLPELDIAEGYYYYWGFRDYDNAIRVLTPVLTTYPNEAQVHGLLGFVYRRMGQFDRALEHLSKALTLEPRSVIVATALSETYILLREAEPAKKYLLRAENLDPGSSRFISAAANYSLFFDGDAEAALNYWQMAQHQFPYEIWWTLASLGRLQSFAAFDDFASTQMLGEIDYTPGMMRGLSLRMVGDSAAAQPLLDEARAHYETLLGQRAGDFRLLKPLCLIDGARADADAAADSCARALQQLPIDAYDRSFHREDIAGALALAGLDQQTLDLVASLLAERAGPTRAELRINPFLTGLHGQPRWRDLMGSE